MTEIKPWEPVSYKYSQSFYGPFEWKSGFSRSLDTELGVNNAFLFDPALHLTLANSQRVIVRALSEERKAARRQKRIHDTYSPFSDFYKNTGSRRKGQ
jgi:hypothetical protein